MAKIANKITDDEKLARFKRKPNSTPVKATKEYLRASLEEKNKDKKKAVKGEYVKQETSKTAKGNKTDKGKETTKSSNTSRNSHYNSSSTYKKINDTVKNKKIDQNQINQETFNSWMDSKRNQKTETNALDLGRQGTQREKQDVGDQKLMKMAGNIVGGMVNVPIKAFDLGKELVNDIATSQIENNRESYRKMGMTDEEIDTWIQEKNDKFDLNDENNWSNLIDKQIEKNRETIYKDTNTVEQFAYQTLEGAGQFGAHMLLAMATGGSSLVTMGLQAGTEKAYQNIQEGYDTQTAIGNGVMTGIMTALVEKLPVDNFGKLVTSPLSQFSLAAIASQAISEGAEEGLEYLIEPQIDRLMLGKEVEYNAGDLFMSIALGMSSGGLIGTVGNAIPIINTKIETRKQFNQLKADMETLIEYKNTNQLTEEETVAIESALTLAQKALNKFESTSVLKNAVQFESDKVNKLSAREIQENFTKFLQPQVDQDIKLNQEQQAVNSILETSQNVLAQKGIQMDALQYSKLDNEVKTEVDKIQSFANSLNTNVVFNSELVTEGGQVIDGMYIPEVGIVINPNGKRKAMSTFVHELTHGTESSQYYAPLKKLLIDADSKYMDKVKNIRSAYKTVANLSLEDATKEYVAIETQDKLGNEQFVESLVKYNTSLANRIYEGIKHIVSITDTEQDIEYNFLKAFRNSGIDASQVNPQYSIGKTMDGIDVALADNAISKKEAKDLKKVKTYLMNYVGKNFKINSDGRILNYDKYDANEYLYSKYSMHLAKYDKSTNEVKKRIVTHLGEIIEVARNPKVEISKHNNNRSANSNIASNGFVRYDTTFGIPIKDLNGDIIDYKLYEGDLVVELNNKTATPYDIVDIKKSNRTVDASTIDTTSRNGANSTGSVTSNNNLSNSSKKIKHSIGLSSSDLDSQGRTLTQEQQEFFKESALRDENGNLKPFYHGTPRADRVGYYFDPNKATSGPMAYFTDNKEIANNYARDKKDTSIAYDERYDSPETQFRVERNGKDIPVGELWKSMSYKERMDFKKKAQQLTKDWDNEDEVVLYFEEGNKYGIGNLSDYEIREKNGNVINALVHSWVTEGNLWGEEHQFLEVLKAMGIEDAYYLDPEYRDEKTYEVYLNVKNPFKTSDVDETFVESLEDFINETDMSKYNKESQHADMWDKNSVDMDDWIYKLNDDIANGTAHVWTSIPDVVTDFLKSNGYDGILDVGGKRGGDLHQVAIPFYSNQIKETSNKKPTSTNDIRYSIGLSNKYLSNKETEKAIRQYMSSQNYRNSPKKAIEGAGAIIPNHEIIRSKYPEFSEFNFNKALLEQLSVGRVSEDTFNALKDDLIKNVYEDDFTQFNQATKQVDEFLDDTIRHFLANSIYQSNKEYMNKISSRAIELLKAYNRLDKNKIESTYDAVEKQQQARDLIKKKKINRKISVAQTVERLIDFGNNKHGSRFKTLEQILDEVANGDIQLRSDLRDTLEMKRFEAQTTYIETLNEYNKLINEVVNLGIKGGSKESKATQWFIEKHKEDGSPYDLDQLLLDFDYNMPNGKKAYDNIQKAAKMISSAYEKLFEDINRNREDIYGDIEINNEIKTKELKAAYEQAKHKRIQIRDELKNNPNEKLEAVYQQQIEEILKLQKQLDAKTGRDENGDSTRRQKLQYRKNYAHHVVKQDFFKNLLGKFDGSSVREVPTYLAGISDDAEPKTGYAKFFSQQTGGAYEADAVEGFAEYIKDAARIIAYDPYIDYLRDFTDYVRAVADGNDMSEFTRFLTEYTNDIAGKTSNIDRGARSLMGDKMFGIVKLINNRVKANAILGNVRTATTQIFNIPNALGVLVDNGGAGSLADVAVGAGKAFKAIYEGKERPWANSPFIQSRYFDTDTGKTGILSTLEGISDLMLTKGDEFSTKLIWSVAYEQALRTNQPDPIFYADDLTRRAVAGRGVGEVPVALQSQFMNLLIPFQVETNNAFRTLNAKVKDKKIASVLTILLANWLFNEISELLYKDRLLFDPIDIIWDAINNKDEEKTSVQHAFETSLSLLGEIGNQHPLGKLFITTFLGLTSEDSETIFGENDPTRYGTGNVGFSVLGSAAKDIVQGNYLDAASDLAASYLLPGGGKQIQRTIEALQVNGMLPQFENGKLVKEPIHYTGNGKVGYVTNPDTIMDSPANFINFAKQVAFGKWTGKEAQEYMNNNFNGLRSDNQNNLFNKLNESMSAYDAYNSVKETDNTKERLEDIENEESGYASTNGIDFKEVDEYKDTLTGKNNAKEKFIQYIVDSDYTNEQKNQIFDEYYGDNNLNEYLNEFSSNMKLDDGKTFELKTLLNTAKSLQDENGKTIKLSKALKIRGKLTEDGIYDEFMQFVNDNDLALDFVGLNSTVVEMSQSEFESKFNSIFKVDKNGDYTLSDAYAATFGSSKSKSESKKKSSKRKEETFSFDEQKAKIDSILAKVYGGTTSTDNAYKKINNIINKVKSNKTNSKIDVKTKYSKLIKDYLKNHPEDTYLFS